MKYTWLALQIEENGLFYAYAMRVSTADNLVSKLSRESLVTANICTSKKEAAATVDAWNAAHKANGKYMFSESF